MIEAGKYYLVMGLLDPESIAFHIGKTIESLGGKVIYTVQNDIIKRRFLDRSSGISDEDRAKLEFRYCDITDIDQVRELFGSIGPLAGIVHSIAFANPRTLLGPEFHTDAMEDIKLAHHISCASLATVLKYGGPCLKDGGSVVALTFDTSHVYPCYNWMGVEKAALEALVRALARRHGRDNIRVNAVSAGPLATKAATKIPGFENMIHMWENSCPLHWDISKDKQGVADGVAFLLGPYAAKITGQTLVIDGGASIIAGTLLDWERPGGPPPPEMV
jgi:meromycolic acid enoyl-[acyl-carrier-protein] reductase